AGTGGSGARAVEDAGPAFDQAAARGDGHARRGDRGESAREGGRGHGRRLEGAAGGGGRAGGVKPYYEGDGVTIYHGDALAVIPELPEFDAVITDPPYSSGGAFRSDRMQSTVAKYVNSDTAVSRPEFSGDNRDQRSFLAWSTLWLA